MRILLLTPRLPWPPLDGGRVAMSRLAEALAARGGEVEVLSLNPRKHRGVPEGPLPIRAVDIDTSRVIAPALLALTGSVPYVVARFVSPRFRDELHAALRRFQPHVVQVESPFLLPYVASVREWGRARAVLRSLNVEFRIWEGLAGIEPDRRRRFLLRRVASSLGAYERRQLGAVDAVVPISQEDADDFRALGCTRPIHVVPCGVKLAALGTESPVKGRVGFIGSLDFRPNQQAVSWILDELWPRVIERAPEATLSIAGSAAPEWLLRRAGERGIELHADVDDARAFVRSVSVFIAPLFAGGGMRIKVLEAMALARPIVATTIGAGGLDVRNERDILLADDAPAFAEAVVRLLRAPEVAARLGAAARATVEQRYDNDLLADGLLRFYESL